MQRFKLSFVISILLLCVTQFKNKTIDNKYSSLEKMYLSMLINAEADQNDILDMRLIGSTVLNRVYNTSFPDDICKVIFQKNQYHGTNSRLFKTSKPSDKVTEDLLKGIGRNYNVLYFFNYKTYTDTIFVNWLRNNRKLIFTTKNHEFYK